MGIAYNSSFVNSSLVLCLDAANKKSYPGTGNTWSDLSGNGNTGTVVNSVGYTSTNSGSMVFDGTDKYINGILTSLPTGSLQSLECVIRLNDVSGTKAIFSHGQSGITFSSGIVIVGNNLRFRNSTNDHALSAPTSLVINQWYHMVLVTTSSETTGYCNGILQGTTSQILTPNSVNNYHIGRRSNNSASEFMNGNIACVRVYQNKALSATEIQQNFNAFRGRYGL